MNPVLDSAANATRSRRGQPARFKEERAARMGGFNTAHAGVVNTSVVHSRYGWSDKRLMMAEGTIPGLFGTSGKCVPPPLSYAGGGVGCLTDFSRPPAFDTTAGRRRAVLWPVLPLAFLVCGFAPFGTPGSASFLMDVRPGPDSGAAPFEASFETRAEFETGPASAFGATGAVVTMPFSYAAGDQTFNGAIAVDFDVRAVVGGSRELQVPSDKATAWFRRDDPVSPFRLPAKGGWLRIGEMYVSPGGSPSAVRATFSLGFEAAAVDGAPGSAGAVEYDFTEAVFVTSPAPEEIVASGQAARGGGGTSVETNIAVGVDFGSGYDTGCGGDTTGDGASAGTDACTGDETDTAADGCDCAGDARAATVNAPGGTPKRIMAHPGNRLVSRYLPFFAVWVFLQGAKGVVRFNKARKTTLGGQGSLPPLKNVPDARRREVSDATVLAVR